MFPTFHFLWKGKKDKGMALVAWERLSRPKAASGWGLKNPFLCGKALAAKS